ncbi:MAG: hypothetical protein ACE14T_03575 [Syntrophales bacterium]
MIAAVLFFSVLWNCAPRVTTTESSKPIARPEEMLADLIRRSDSSQALKTRARFFVDCEEGKFSARMILIAKRPSFLRVESVPVIGLPDLFMTADGHVLKIFLPNDGKFYIGRPTRKNLSLFFPVYLDEKDIISLVEGIPPAVGAKDTIMVGNMESGGYRIDLFSGGEKRQTLWIEPASRRLVKVSRPADVDAAAYTAELTDYRHVGERDLPGRIRIVFEEPRRIIADIHLSDTEFTAVEEGSFNLEIPPGMVPLYLD